MDIKYRKEIERRLSEYDLTLNDFNQREINEMEQELKDRENPSIGILDGWFGGTELIMRGFRKKLVTNGRTL